MARMSDPYLSLPLDGLRLIEASAGTGKTFTLATVFTRLVVEQHLRMGQILAVTFTEPATQELRARIRERLELAARILQREAAPDDDQETILTRAILERALDTQSKSQLQARLRLAAEETDLAWKAGRIWMNWRSRPNPAIYMPKLPPMSGGGMART